MAGLDHEHAHHDHSSDHDHTSDHDHSSDHDQAEDHHHVDESEDSIQRKGVLRRLYLAALLCTCFIIVEIVGGLMAHSLAILSDAAHLFSDLTSFAVAIVASYLASMPTTRQHTFGLKRTESLSALFSMISLALVCVGLGYEAIHRLINPPEHLVNGKIMSGIALIGVLVNIALAFVLGEHHVHLPGAHSHGHGDHHDEEGHDDDHDHDHDHGHEKHEVHERPSQQQIGGVEMLPSYQKPNGDPHSHDHDHHDDQEKGHSHGHNDHDTTNNHDNGNDQKHCEVHTSEVPFNHATTDKRNINLRAAYLHVLGDLAQSVAVLIAGVIIWVRPDLHIIDPILTLLFAVLVLYSTFGVVRESIAVMLEATPPNISWEKVHEAIMKVPNVEDVHDLHIWSISHGQPILSVHCQSKDSDALGKIRDQCLTFGISHATIQVQHSEGSCLTCAGTMYSTRHLA